MSYDSTLKRYDDLVEKCSGFDRKGKTMPYTSSNGHMFSLLNKDGELGLRFSKETQKAYFEKFNTSFLMSHGAKMNGYIEITGTMLNDTTLMLELFQESLEFVNSLPPK